MFIFALLLALYKCVCVCVDSLVQNRVREINDTHQIED